MSSFETRFASAVEQLGAEFVAKRAELDRVRHTLEQLECEVQRLHDMLTFSRQVMNDPADTEFTGAEDDEDPELGPPLGMEDPMPDPACLSAGSPAASERPWFAWTSVNTGCSKATTFPPRSAWSQPECICNYRNPLASCFYLHGTVAPRRVTNDDTLIGRVKYSVLSQPMPQTWKQIAFNSGVVDESEADDRKLRNVRSALSELRRSGEIVRTKRGVYAPPSWQYGGCQAPYDESEAGDE